MIPTLFPAARRSLAAIFLAGLVADASAQAADWSDLAGVQTVTITTTTPEATLRETTIWLVVVDGVPYVRTGSTRWAADIAANPEVKLDVDGQAFPLRAVPVTDPTDFERIQQAIRDKYGWKNTFALLLPGAGTKVFRLDASPGT